MKRMIDCCPACRSVDIAEVPQKCGHTWEFHDSKKFGIEDYSDDCVFGGPKYRCGFCGKGFDKPARRTV